MNFHEISVDVVGGVVSFVVISKNTTEIILNKFLTKEMFVCTLGVRKILDLGV